MRRPQPRPQTTSMADPLGMLTMLSVDLVLEILYRLPVKSLMILKCVCKPLNSIVSDPKFAKDHLRLSQTRHHHFVLCPEGIGSKRNFLRFDPRLPSIFDNSTLWPTITPKEIIKFPLNPSNICNVILTTNSCNGVICFKTTESNYHGDLVVWNPSTRKYKILPPLENLLQDTFLTRYSIGYDGFSDNYKVVAITFDLLYRSNFFCKTEVRVHTLGTNFWKRISDFPSEIMDAPYRCYGIFVSGIINWIIRRHQENGFSWIILSPDLGKESYQEILHPDFGLDDSLHIFSLGVSRKCLCVLAHTKDFLDIWVMKDYGNKDSWNKFITVPFAVLGYCSGFFSLVYISEEDGQLFLCCGRLYVYNYKNRTVKIPEIQGFPSTRFAFNVYFESLISP